MNSEKLLARMLLTLLLLFFGEAKNEYFHF